MAALESGVLTPSTTIVDTGTFSFGPGTEPLHNAGRQRVRARSSFPAALQVSSDVFFYNVGAMLDRDGNGAQQKWASELGIGHPTGIDLPDEMAGLLPTPAWRNKLYKEAQDPDSPGGTTIIPGKDPTDRPWSAGDAVNLAVGQGDLQADPLQMAVAYAAIANGGDVVRPHVGLEVKDPRGGVVQEIDPGPQRHLDIKPQYRQAILEGIHMAAQSPGGTSYDVFGNFPVPMAGKTGTAQREPQADQSWYVALAPVPEPGDRGRGDDRAGRVRGGRRGAGGAPDTRCLLQHPQAGGQVGRGQGALAGVDPGRPAPAPPPRGTPTDGLRRLPAPLRRAPRGRPGARRHPGARPDAAAGDAGAGRLQPVHAQGGDRGGHPPRPLFLRRPPGDLRSARASP